MPPDLSTRSLSSSVLSPISISLTGLCPVKRTSKEIEIYIKTQFHSTVAIPKVCTFSASCLIVIRKLHIESILDL
jgi:hypothetical protein